MKGQSRKRVGPGSPAASRAEGPRGGVAVDRRGPDPGVRIVISALIGFHLAALVIAAAATPPRNSPPSFLLRDAFRWVGWYLEPLYLDHDYRFYADEPAPTPLLYCVLHYPDGRTGTLQLPRKAYFSRLRYSRHLALVHNLAAFMPPPETATREVPPGSPEARQLDAERKQFREWARASARFIGRRHGADRVELFLRFHLIPSVEAVENGIAWNDPSLFRDTRIGVFSCTRP